jgi:hypothetical protein
MRWETQVDIDRPRQTPTGSDRVGEMMGNGGNDENDENDGK